MSANFIKGWKLHSSGKKTSSGIGNDNANNNSGRNSTIITGKGKVYNTMNVQGDVKIYHTPPGPISDLTFSANPDAGAPSSRSSNTPFEDALPSTDGIEHTSPGSRSTESNNGQSSQDREFDLPIDPQWINDTLPHNSSAGIASIGSGRSSMFGTRVTYLKRLSRSDVKHHLPESTAEHIVSYMLTNPLSGNINVIPLWEPSPSLHSHPQKWRKNVYIGDVGVFNSEGGFDTHFNILQTLEENRARHLDPPSNFYPFKLLDQSQINTHHHETDEPKYCGFVCDNSTKNLSTTLHLPETTIPGTTIHCSAIYMAHGYDRLILKESVFRQIDSYLQEHRADWEDHFGSNNFNNRRRNTLLLITACDRVKSWSLAAATSMLKPFVKKRTGTAVLKDIQRSGRDSRKVWAVVGDIETTDGPSSPHMEDEDSYFRNFGTTIDAKTRHEIEACHCIAVQASYLDKKWTLSSLKSNQSTIKGSVHAPHPVASPQTTTQKTPLSRAPTNISSLPSITE